MVTAVGSFLVVLSQLGLLPKPQDAPPLAASKPRAETPAVAPPPDSAQSLSVEGVRIRVVDADRVT